MTATRRMTFDVPEDLARRIEAEVADAGYESESALVVESLEIHFDHSRYDGSNPEIERWLREKVLPTIERMDRDGPAGLTSEEVFGGVRERYLARAGGTTGGTSDAIGSYMNRRPVPTWTTSMAGSPGRAASVLQTISSHD